METGLTIIKTYDDAERAAKAMSASGFFADSHQAAQAIVKILAGMELGFGAFASMTGVHIIKNKPTLAANLMAAAVKRGGKYNYKVIRLDNKGCELAFYEGGAEVGRSKFDEADAKQAGLLGGDNWVKYPRNMYFARAISNGQKWYAPDIFNGVTVYTPDEMGAQVDEEGNAVIIEGSIVEPIKLKPTNTTDSVKAADRPYQPADLKAKIQDRFEVNSTAGKKANGKRNVLAAALNDTYYGNEDDRHAVCEYLTGFASTKDMPDAYVISMLEWLGVNSFNEKPTEMAIQEAALVLTLLNQEA